MQEVRGSMNAVGASRTQSTAWRTRDIVVVAVIAVAFGAPSGVRSSGRRWRRSAWPRTSSTGGLLPAIVAPLVVRKLERPCSRRWWPRAVGLRFSQWSVDTLRGAGVLQGGAAELVFLGVPLSHLDVPGAAAALPAATAATVHDWIVYYATYDAVALGAIAVFMAISGAIILPAVAPARRRRPGGAACSRASCLKRRRHLRPVEARPTGSASRMRARRAPRCAMSPRSTQASASSS